MKLARDEDWPLKTLDKSQAQAGTQVKNQAATQSSSISL